MYLLVKGKKARAICRECKKLHEQKDCPRAVDWAAVEAAGDRFYRWAMAYQEEIRRNG